MKQSKRQTSAQKARRKPYIAQFYRGNRLAFAGTLTQGILMILINLALSWNIQQIIDAATGSEKALPLGVLTLVTLGMIAAVFVLSAIRYVCMPRFMKRAMSQYKQYAFGRLTQKSIASFSSEDSATYLSAFSNDAYHIETNYLEKQFDIVENVALLVGAIAMMLAYHPLMALISCAFFILPVGVSFFVGTPMEKAERKVSDRNSAFVATLKDCLGGFSVVKSFRAEQAVTRLFHESTAQVEQAKCEKRRLVTVISTAASAAGFTAQMGTFLVGGFLALAGFGITPGILMAFVNLSGCAIESVRALPEQLAGRKASAALIDKLDSQLTQNIQKGGEKTAEQLKSSIALQNVSFSYDEGKPVLQDVSVRFAAGKSYAVVGASGSGKSTLLNLLMASYSEYSGQILYDGTELRELTCESLYDRICLVQQNVFVFNASIRDNITMFSSFPKEAVDRAISLAGLSELIAARGEDYLCGENGSGLSGGEKQRIAIARSLLKNAQVLLVDEATASLDAQTAFQVSSAILNLHGITRIVVTHRLDEALLRRYDGIVTMKNGAVEECGTFSELMEKKGYFSALFAVSQR